jgi:uroporphyrin-III C-methyltransferase
MNQKTDDTKDSPEGPVAEPAEVPAGEKSGEPAVDGASDVNEEPGYEHPGATGEPLEEPDLETRATGADVESASLAQPARRSIGAFTCWLALLLSLAALAGFAWLAWQGRNIGVDAAGNEAAIASLSDNLDATKDSLQDFQSRLSGLGETAQKYSQDIAALERELDEFGNQYESVARRLANLENTIASLQGVSAGVRETWALAEAEYYMQIANAQLQLAGNPRIAALALGFADDRIRQMADPALGEVRRALMRELQELESMEPPDVEGLTLALLSLADRVESLPLNEQVALPDDDKAPIDPELSGLDRAVASMKRAFGDVVSVRRTDEAVTPLMSPDAVYFLRANLSLKFEAARLALLKGEQAVFERSLDDAAAWLREFYDANSRPVASALATISDLKGSSADVLPPDISESLRLLRQYRTMRDADTAASNGNNDSASDESSQ